MELYHFYLNRSDPGAIPALRTEACACDAEALRAADEMARVRSCVDVDVWCGERLVAAGVRSETTGSDPG